MKNNWIKELILIIIALVPIVYIFFVWDKLPLEIATHFDLEWNANGYTQRKNISWIIGGFTIISYLLLRFLPILDPRYKLDLMGGNFFKIQLIIMSLISGIFTFIAYISVNEDLDASFFSLAFGIFLIIMGNYMQTLKSNYFIGMRTPWTLQSEKVWRKTHKLAGILMIIAGITITTSFIFLPKGFSKYIFLPSILLSFGIPYIYSYLLFKKETHENNI